uniref:Uncharacterized protein n=1 Tax=Myoviridae sp. ctPuP5 TaxID=2823543 RepID=A0A8S5L9L3_9CAUD|nr:MAG TPA: hypothetical protein [Myoviridae sp. ctPuP5]
MVYSLPYLEVIKLILLISVSLLQIYDFYLILPNFYG